MVIKVMKVMSVHILSCFSVFTYNFVNLNDLL